MVAVQPHLATLLTLGESELNAFLAANSEDALKTLRRVLQWLAGDADATARFAEDDAELPHLNALVGLANLQSVLKLWRDNADNGDEEFCNRLCPNTPSCCPNCSRTPS